MSKVLLGLAERLLAQPPEKTSSEGCAATLLLAHVAWNRAVDPLAATRQVNTAGVWPPSRQRTRSASKN